MAGRYTLFTTVTPSDPSATFTGQAGNTSASTASRPTRPATSSRPPPPPRPRHGDQHAHPGRWSSASSRSFRRKLNKKGKPVGKAVLSGFTFEFGTPLNPSAAGNAANYQVDSVTTKKVKKKVQHVLHPITNFTVSYTRGERRGDDRVRPARRRSRPADRSRSWTAFRAARSGNPQPSRSPREAGASSRSDPETSRLGRRGARPPSHRHGPRETGKSE